MDGMVNWEATSSDGDRFNSENTPKNERRKGLACFDEYLKRKEARKQKKDLEKIKKAQAKQSKIPQQTQASEQLH